MEQNSSPTFSQEDLAYLKRSESENPEFWSRLGGRPDFTGKKVLDVGCGHGGLCMDAAERGAARVVGIDLDAERVSFANAYRETLSAEMQRRLAFKPCALGQLEEDDFDFILSKDSFEHIMHLDEVLAAMRERLKPGGRVCVGFSPLYNSYNGAHGRSGVKLPWGHLLFGERAIVKRINRRGGRTISSVRDLGVNMYSLAEHTKFLRESGMEIIYFRVNASNHPLLKLFSIMRAIPLLREYFSHNLYVILQKRPA
jgi:SAM-dependent methyltransferase